MNISFKLMFVKHIMPYSQMDILKSMYYVLNNGCFKIIVVPAPIITDSSKKKGV